MAPALKNDCKSLLRNKLRACLAAIPLPERRKKSLVVCARLWRSDFVQEARAILIYAARKDELDTRPLIRRLLHQGKTVYIPRVSPRGVLLYRIHDFKKDLRPGIYGILEPRPHQVRRGQVRHLDLAIIPGLGFTAGGVRLGRGGGHFDRLLAHAPHVVKIGVGFREQLLKKIPAMPHDVRMNFIVTD